jgi:hypothetical protein
MVPENGHITQPAFPPETLDPHAWLRQHKWTDHEPPYLHSLK